MILEDFGEDLPESVLERLEWLGKFLGLSTLILY